MSVIKHPPHMGWLGWLPPPSASVTLTWIQEHLLSLGIGEWSHWCSEDTDLSDGNWVVIPNLKDILGEALGCKSTSSTEVISSIGSLPCHPPPHPVMMERGGHLSASLCPLCLWSYISPCYGRSFTYALFTCTKFTGSLEFTIGTKA